MNAPPTQAASRQPAPIELGLAIAAAAFCAGLTSFLSTLLFFDHGAAFDPGRALWSLASIFRYAALEGVALAVLLHRRDAGKGRPRLEAFLAVVATRLLSQALGGMRFGSSSGTLWSPEESLRRALFTLVNPFEWLSMAAITIAFVRIARRQGGARGAGLWLAGAASVSWTFHIATYLVATRLRGGNDYLGWMLVNATIYVVGLALLVPLFARLVPLALTAIGLHTRDDSPPDETPPGA